MVDRLYHEVHSSKFRFFVDRLQFANTVLWLEDQKIRHYKIEDRAALRAIGTPNWEQNWESAYRQYKDDVGMIKLNGAVEELSWLTSYAVRLEYMDNSKSFLSPSQFSSLKNIDSDTFQSKRTNRSHRIGSVNWTKHPSRPLLLPIHSTIWIWSVQNLYREWRN